MPRPKRIKVLLCNKHNLFREGIKALFPKSAPIAIVGEAATASQALNLLERLQPDVILLDATTSDLGGSEATRRIKAINPRVEILILSLYDDELLVSDCIGAGAIGCISKKDDPLNLERAISMAYRRAQHAA